MLINPNNLSRTKLGEIIRTQTSKPTTQDNKIVKARQWYASVAADICGRPEERDYVTGFADVNGETWCRISDGPGRTAKILTHPSMLRTVSR